MPTYEYECKKCGLRFEKFQNIKAKPLRTCVDCGGSVRRLIGTGVSIIMKGSGSRATDARDAQRRLCEENPICGSDAPCNSCPLDG